MERTKKFEFHIADLTDEAKDRFIKFLGGDNGNHDVIPFCVYETVCEDGECPHYGDTDNDCADCTNVGDYHYQNGECVRRD